MRRNVTVVLTVFFLLFFSHGSLRAADSPTTDLRVVIDVSGSMKQTDPDNLRRPALKLLTGIMPEGTRSGVWTFGQYVNMAVPYGRVDTQWKARARAEADKLHARGLYTNIETALEKAAFNWQQPEPDEDRHLLLLTDGKVDVSETDAEDRASRQRILNELLPRLVKAGVRIHTLGLSEGIDRELLTTLSAASGGWYEETRNSEDLQRLFLRLFEKAVPVQTLPLANNVFEVDEQIKDMTLLVFRKPEDPPLQIETPQQQRWNREQHPDPVIWHAEQNYDLVTVESPAAGKWQLQTREDPDNRVMILTNLSLHTDPLPDQLLAHEQLLVRAWLNDGEQRIADAQFLELVDMRLQAVMDQQPGPPVELALNATPEPGIYQRAVRNAFAEGQYTLHIRASAPTFERERVHHLRVYAEPLRSMIEEKPDGGYQLRIEPVVALFEPGSIQLAAHTREGEPIELVAQEDHWQAVIPKGLQADRVLIELQARRHDGRDFFAQVERRIGHTDSQQTANAGASQPKADRTSAEDSHNTGQETVDLSWQWIIAIIALSNLFLILVGLAIYTYLRRLRRDILAAENKELDL